MPTAQITLKYSEYAHYKQKYKARQAVHRALKKKLLIRPTHCEICDREGIIEAHHIDYSKPLLVFWLCQSCHGVAHRKGHALNPVKTHSEVCDVKSSIFAGSCLPFEQFVYLKELASDNNTTIAALIRVALMKTYPLTDPQKTFDLDQQHEKDRCYEKEICDLAEDARSLQEQKFEQLQSIRRSRDPCLPGMECFI